MDLVPKKKPEKSKTDADYKKRINSLLIGFYGTGPEYRGLAVDEIQKTLDEAEQKGVLSKQDGLSFVQERKNITIVILQIEHRSKDYVES